MEKIGSMAVFCASSRGRSEAYGAAAAALGRSMAEKGITLVYGGGNRGVMGILARAVREHGCTVTGVLPKAMDIPSVTDGSAATRTIVTPDMHSRKSTMYSLSDAFVALPGGIGTMEEILEIFTWKQLGYTDGNVGLLNVDGFWNPMIAALERARDEGFLAPEVLDSLIVESDVERLIERLGKEDKELPSKL